MKNLRAAVAQEQKRSSSMISRIRAHHRGSSDSSSSSKSIGTVESATVHNMLSTPYSLTRPSLLT